MRTERSKLPRWLLWCLGVVAVWAILALMLVLQFLPDTPKTTRGWVLLLVFGPPAYALLDGLGERRSAKTRSLTSPTRFSFVRVALALPVVLLAFAASAALAWWVLRAGR